MSNSLFERIIYHSKNLSVYLFAAVIPMVLSVLINPLVSMTMSPEDFAIVSYYTAFNTLFTPVVTFYLTHYYTKRYFELDYENRIILRATICKSLITFSFLVSIVIFLLFYIYHTYLKANSGILFFPYALLSVFSIPLTGIYTLTLVEYRMKRASMSFFKLSVGNGVTLTLLTLLLVVVLKFGATGKLLSVFATALIMFLITFYINKDIIKVKADRNVLCTSIIFCFPLVIAAVLSFFTGGYDKILLERQGDLHTLGIYAVGASIASYLNVFTTSINDTFQPDIFQSVVQRNFKKCAKIVLLKVCIISAVVGTFVICAPFLIKILTAGRYVESTPFAVIISVSSITSMMYYSFSQITIARGFNKITLINKIIGSIICVGLYYALINKWGAYGAAWGIVLSYIVFLLGNVILYMLFDKNEEN